MRRKVEPLLCELHAHTRWSDGAFTVPELVDLYGRNGFDVLCITDHVNRTDDPWLPADAPMRGVHAANHADYLAEIEAQAERARREYDLLLLPGIELSYNDLDPFLAAHAVAVGCRAFVSVDGGLDAALARARGEGAALVAAHPYGRRRAAIPSRTTQLFFREWRALREARRPLGAVQPLEAVRLGGGARPARCRQRRLPPRGAPVRPGRRCCPAQRASRAAADYLCSPRPAFLTRIDDIAVPGARRAA